MAKGYAVVFDKNTLLPYDSYGAVSVAFYTKERNGELFQDFCDFRSGKYNLKP